MTEETIRGRGAELLSGRGAAARPRAISLVIVMFSVIAVALGVALWRDADRLSAYNAKAMQADPATLVLARAMGHAVPMDRYRTMVPAVRQALIQSCSVSVDRMAMWLAQVGTESGGLRWMEEIADGADYEGRLDLGNVQAGDGVRFKGRGPIQVTGRDNYTRLSEWAYQQGLVPSVTFFTDHPQQLSSDTYGFIGVVWYWTIARDMNGHADRNDIVGATRAINGGVNGLPDRAARWLHAQSLGLQLVALATDWDSILHKTPVVDSSLNM